MRLTATVTILGKVQKPWTDSAGNPHTAYSVNIMQNNGEIVDFLRLNQEQFASVEVNQPYIITADFGVGKNGGYLRLVDIVPKNKL